MTKTEQAWSASYTFGGRVFHVFERPDRDGLVYVKFSDPNRTGRDRRRKVKLGSGLRVRNGKGHIDAHLCRLVQRAAEEVATAVRNAISPQKDTESSVLTLSAGFKLALDLEQGKYPAKTRRWATVVAAAKDLERILGSGTSWSDIRPRDIRRVWRTLAATAAKLPSGERLTGMRKAEVLVDAFYSVAAWLELEEILDAGSVVPLRGWRKLLKEEWKKATGADLMVRRPRHSESDWANLFSALEHPDVDPRFRLLFDLGAEQRLGQVLRCRRSHLRLPIVDSDRVTPIVGELHVPGDGRKRASVIALTRAQRNTVEAALNGYLAPYEQRYLQDPTLDFPLFPSGRLKQGLAKLREAPSTLTRDAARKMFQQLEDLAGVAHQIGRGWYGIRRVATDLAEDATKDERVLNQLTGHRDSSTRRLVYQDRAHPEVLRQAAELREQLRSASRAISEGGSDRQANDASA